MCRIIRWIGYASTVIGAILIIMAIVGGFRYHHHFMHSHMPEVCCNMQHSRGNMEMSKTDSASCKQHSISANMPMGKQDSVKSCKKQMMCYTSTPMACITCQMYHHRIGFHMGLAISFLLLAIALFMISSHCRCKHCCECKDGKCECKEEKKE
jgi:carbon starvation protein CstA